MLRGKRILVTGGGGFIGSEIVLQLCQLGANVDVLDNFSSGKPHYLDGLNVTIVRGNVCDQKLVGRLVENEEMIIHLAALPFIPDSYVNPDEFFEVNVKGTVNLVLHALKNESLERFVYISSSEVYGSARYAPMDEDHPTLPQSTYAVSKLAADRAVFTLHKEHGVPCTIIRPFNSYGPRITQPYIIPEIINQVLRSDVVALGNTESSRDFTHVSDTARGIILALTAKDVLGEVINLGNGQETRISDLVEIISSLLGKKVEVKCDEGRTRPFDVHRLICNNSKAKKLLNWAPRLPLLDGLASTVEWIRQNRIELRTPFRGWSRTTRF